MVRQILYLFSTNYFCIFVICLRIFQKLHSQIWDFWISTLIDLVHYGFGIYGFGLTDLGLTDLDLRICPATDNTNSQFSPTNQSKRARTNLDTL